MRSSSHQVTKWARSAMAPGLTFVIAIAASTHAGVLVEKEQALSEAFPGAEWERVTVYLTEAQAVEVERQAGSRPSSRAAFFYRGRRDGELLGTAYFDRHVVRTKAETVMVVVLPGGKLGKVEVIAFDEPQDYLPPPRWLEQFDGKSLDAQLGLKRGIRGITGATLSARSITKATRRILALHAMLGEDDTPDPESPPKATDE